MDMRGGFMMRPRERGPLMRPGFPPLRGRGPMMDRVRLLPPRPALMRGAPPAFVGRPMGLPPGRPRVMGPVMLPRPMPPHGALGPLGPRGMLPPPRPMLGPLPPRPLPPDMSDGLMPNLSLNKDNNMSQNKMNQTIDSVESHNNNRDMRNNRTARNNQTGMQQQSNQGLKKNRKDNKNRRVLPSQVSQPSQIPQVSVQTPIQPQHQSVQNVHPNIHHPSQGPPSSLPPQQNSMHMNQPPMQKHIPPMQSQVIPSQSGQNPHQNSVRGGRNGMPHRNRGNGHMGNRTNIQTNYTPNIPNTIPQRPNRIMNGPPAGPPATVQYSNAPPPSYAVPPPQVPMKRGAPPSVNPPQQATMPPPKRIRYEAPAPSNGYPCPPYQQPPPQQQPSYSMSYEMPPPTSTPVQSATDMYGNVPPPSNTGMGHVQTYTPVDYGNYQMAPPTNHTYNGNSNMQYSTTYATNQSYSNSYSPSGYDTSIEYSSAPAQTMSNTDPYAGYSKPVSTVDAYGYSNSSYTTAQPAYEDYSSGYVDNSAYTQSVPDQSYGQSMNTYSSYSY